MTTKREVDGVWLEVWVTGNVIQMCDAEEKHFTLTLNVETINSEAVLKAFAECVKKIREANKEIETLVVP